MHTITTLNSTSYNINTGIPQTGWLDGETGLLSVLCIPLCFVFARRSDRIYSSQFVFANYVNQE
ncbi:MAG: hypothetical protein D3913_12505 [Candidatus Electrothrix sp. LOE1_4_5]|nr:hypothetical protein [Candidatus Electrothrix gigas]